MSQVLKFGVVGLGRAATSFLPSLAAHPGVRIIAGTAPRAEAREAFAREFDADGYGSIEALCENPEVDALYIATPHQFHRQNVMVAAEHGKHIIVEKPMALTIEDCEAMNE